MTETQTPELLDCGHAESPHSEFTSGYGIDEHGKKHCYSCCAERDRKQMRETGRITLYLTSQPDRDTRHYKITNWPGSLEFQPWRVREGRHNLAGRRWDVWFNFEGQTWHGVQYGNNSDLCRCRRVQS